MARFFYQYSPQQVSHTGCIFIQQYTDSNYPSLTWDAVISDGITHYGALIGTGDDLSKCMQAIEGRFSATRLSESVFLGIVDILYNPTPGPMNETPLTLTQFLAAHEINVPVNNLPNVKDAKKFLFKELAKKRFPDWNDSHADLAKINTLFTFHYPNLTVQEKATVDNLSNTLLAIYPKATCINAYQTMVTDLANILSSYYSKTVEVENATTKAQVMAIELE